MFKAAVAAGPVYRLLGRKDLGTTELPPLDTPLTTGDIGWHYHTGGHTATPGRLEGVPHVSLQILSLALAFFARGSRFAVRGSGIGPVRSPCSFQSWVADPNVGRSTGGPRVQEFLGFLNRTS
jgi:hypothetical protein